MMSPDGGGDDDEVVDQTYLSCLHSIRHPATIATVSLPRRERDSTASVSTTTNAEVGWGVR